jgi:hypothetical protein
MIIHLALVNGRMRGEISSDHVSSEHLAAFLDGRLTGAERDRAVRHFASCGECRAELTALRDVIDSPGATPVRRRIVAVAAAAAILAIIAIPRIASDPANGGHTNVRAAEGAGVAEAVIAVVSPADQATVAPSGVKLSWRAAGPAATYSITVQDSAGGEVWKRSSLPDTSITIPDSIRLRPGSLYFWSVDARLADGSTAKTGARAFIVR